MRPGLTRAAACFCSALLLAPVSAQNATPQPAPVLRVTTRLVQVNVVVHGKKNEPVLGLTKDDFEVTDAGVPQQVATLAVESMLAPPPAPGAKPLPPLPPNVFTNLALFKPATPKAITVILMDGLNTPFADQAYARQQLIKFLHTLTSDDRVALYTLGRDIRILHDFTDDHMSLLKALDKHKNHIGPELADSNPAESNTGNDDLDSFLDGANQKIADFQNISRVRTTLQGLEAIAQHLSALPGRKNLVWISGGFPLDIGMDSMSIDSTAERRTFTDETERAARALTSAQLAIYPVDARGLMTDPGFAASTPTPKNVTRPPQGPSAAMRNIQKTHDSMEMIAKRTGGKAYYNSNDLKGAIRGAIDDAKVTYIVGYYPTHNTWDGKFHELKVRVKRSGVNVRHRLGYFAFAEQPRTETSRRAALMEAAWSPLDATNIAVSARLAPDVPKKGNLRVLMVIEPRQITFEQKDDHWTGLVDVLFVQQPASDKGTTVTNEVWNLNFTKERYIDTMKRGMIMVKDLDFAAAAYKLKVVVRDAASGNVGSINVRTDKLQPVPPAPAKPAVTPANPATPAEKK